MVKYFFGQESLVAEGGRSALRRRGLPANALWSREVFFLDCAPAMPAVHFKRLAELFRANQGVAEDLEKEFARPGCYLVLPRAGLISAWSSGAGDICRVARFSGVRRVERGLFYRFDQAAFAQEGGGQGQVSVADVETFMAELHDRMTERVIRDAQELETLFESTSPAAFSVVTLGTDSGQAAAAIRAAAKCFGFQLSVAQIAFLLRQYAALGRSPTDLELMMFAQVNSEHCRHHVFNARWDIGGVDPGFTLFDLIRQTRALSPSRVLCAYEDNAAVVESSRGNYWQVAPDTGVYGNQPGDLVMVLKVETHNHPTAIAPFPGAGTGAGGEIRDEAATGRGARPLAGMCGFIVSDLHLPGHPRSWEKASSVPPFFADPCQIMLEGPVGAARFNNEFGRPGLGGFFRTFEHRQGTTYWGYHKPVMIAGGMGTAPGFSPKRKVLEDAMVVVLGGPAMLIGLGGGSSSSQTAGTNRSELDYASVQRANAEMQRRCQEVIDRCVALGEGNPILAIHDVGAGGLANAVPELLAEGGCGGTIELADVPSADFGMSPLELWCNEAQERYVLVVVREHLGQLSALCERERCPVAVIGVAKKNAPLIIRDRRYGNEPASVPMDMLIGKVPGGSKVVRLPSLSSSRVNGQAFQKPVVNLGDIADAGQAQTSPSATFSPADVELEEAVERVLKFPAVGSKNFLITIADRTVSGLVSRDQLVGPYQVPVSDCAVCAVDYIGYAGQAMAMGERTPVAVWNAPASGRLAVAEALTNIFAADVPALTDISLSANWMAAQGYPGQDAALYETVCAVTTGLCSKLGIAIPMGKDSLSMRTEWREQGKQYEVVSPLSLVVTSFAPVTDVRKTSTPELLCDQDTVLLLIDFSRGKNRLGGSVLEQVCNVFGNVPADLDCPEDLQKTHGFLRRLRAAGMLLACHDRSDGGLFVTLCEMAFAAHTGLEIGLSCESGDAPGFLFSEEPGLVIQVAADALPQVEQLAAESGLGDCCHQIGQPSHDLEFRLLLAGRAWSWDLMQLKKWWWDTSYRIQSLRDDSVCARQERDFVIRKDAYGLRPSWRNDVSSRQAVVTRKAPGTKGLCRPKVAVFREQGVNGQREMAAAFHGAGFTAVDVHTSDLASGRCSLKSFHGLAACGGFSFGDVLGAGRGWAASILYHPLVCEELQAFFARPDTFGIGVCNGCQMFSQIKQLIPGTESWPCFVGNRSRQFEARLSLVEVLDTRSIFFAGMANSLLMVPVAHAEGRVVFEDGVPEALAHNTCLRYVGHADREATENYPENPNGSTAGITGFCNDDGRITILMPHPERVFRGIQFSWRPKEWEDASPWSRFFENAKLWLDN